MSTRFARMLSEDQALVLKRALAVAVLLVLGVCAVASLARPDSAALVVAPRGMCYIAPDAGARWHVVRQCRTLVRSRHVDCVRIAEAARLGEGNRWNRPCRICGFMLRGSVSHRELREDLALIEQDARTDSVDR
jgi:hypothetical protein